MSLFSSKETVERLGELPKPDGGAPCPIIVSDEHDLYLAYYIQEIDPNWDGTTVKVINPLKTISKVAVVHFDHFDVYTSGFPNDEVIEGHRLFEKGLRPWEVYEVKNSQWIQELEKVESVHYSYRGDFFKDHRHFIFVFKDSTFECVAKGFSLQQLEGTVQNALSMMVGKLREG